MDVENDALIAQALWAEENYQEYGAFGADAGNDTDDSDYSSAKRKKKGKSARAPPAKRGRQSKAPTSTAAAAAPNEAGPNAAATANDDQAAAPPPGDVAPTNAAANDCNEDDVADGGRRKRKDAGQSREKGRAWTNQEEALFLEALTLYGRDWKRCAEHVETRDSKAISSHMQKHLIKLCLAGAPLPPKVAESGIGYTLSGKLLDPTSSAARAYGFKPELIQRLTGVQLETALAGIQQEGMPLMDATNSSKDATAQAAQAHLTQKAAPARQPKRCKTSQDDSTVEPSAANAGTAPAAPNGLAAAAAAEGAVSDDECDAAPAPVVQTEYARNRPRRETAGQRLAMLGDTSESLDMIKCCDFVGPAGSGMALAQPFSAQVAMEAMVTMEVHAHLSSCEIIGLLGGTWDPCTRSLCVREAHPCRRAAGSDARTSVELDAEAEVEARARMDEAGQTCVGWYHSHPVFEPCPSQKDCDNQRNYQALLRDHESKVEPFIGIILGPYDLAMPQPLTAITAFVVQQKAAGLQPYNVRYTMQGRDAAPSASLRPKLTALLELFKEDIGRIDFAAAWRPFTSIAGGAVSGPPCSKLFKLTNALKHQLARAPAEVVEEFVGWLCGHIQDCWQVDLSAVLLQPKQQQPTGTAADAAATAAASTDAAALATTPTAPQSTDGHYEEGAQDVVSGHDCAQAAALPAIAVGGTHAEDPAPGAGANGAGMDIETAAAGNNAQ